MTSIRFVGDLPLWAALLLGALGFILAWRFYRRESKPLSGHLPWLLPTIRGTAILLTLLILAGPVLHHRYVEGTLGEVLILVDTSASMGLSDALMSAERKRRIATALGWIDTADTSAATGADMSEAITERFNQASRLVRSESALLDPSIGLLSALRESHRVRVSAFAAETLNPLWDSAGQADLPASFATSPDGASTQIGWAASRVAAVTGNTSSDAAERIDTGARSRSAIVILTDGQNNSGVAPLQVARSLGSQQIPVYTIGLGDPREPTDVALLNAEYPSRVFAKNRVRGKLSIKDHLPAGSPFTVSIKHEDEVLWSENLESINSDAREINFDLDLEAVAERLQSAAEREVKFKTLPISLTAVVSTSQPDFVPSNDQFPLHVAVVTSQYKILLIDGRSRWESRYLKNAFERDETWKLTSVVLHAGNASGGIPVGDKSDQFPAQRSDLIAYDLIVLGDIASQSFTVEQLGWMRDFVDLTGGGLIWIDGPRGHLNSYADSPLGPLLPVKRTGEPLRSKSEQLRLTSFGMDLSPFLLDPSESANERLWQELPQPHWSAVSEALPGSEVLAETVYREATLPTFVTRRFGAGKVLYSAIDESWRWRYKVSDQYHQRFWNQVARWVMRPPMAVSDDHVSLDSGDTTYSVGDIASIRARVQDAQGRGVTDAAVEALIWRDEQLAASVFLTADPQNPGFYAGQTAPLTTGKYEVSIRASGFPQEAMKARTEFTVTPETYAELQRIACNEELLKQIAEESKGQFLSEEDFRQLPAMLEPLSDGRVIESETLLWQSYWWFIAIVGLLAIEWWLRKRGGLL